MRCRFEKKLPRRINEFQVLKFPLQNCEGKGKRKKEDGQNRTHERQLTFPPLPPAPAVRRCTSCSTSPELARRSAVGGRLASGSGGGSDQIALSVLAAAHQLCLW